MCQKVISSSKRLFSSLTLVWHLAGGGSYNALVMYSILSLSLFLSLSFLSMQKDRRNYPRRRRRLRPPRRTDR
jgi:hypothetical protein